MIGSAKISIHIRMIYSLQTGIFKHGILVHLQMNKIPLPLPACAIN